MRIATAQLTPELPRARRGGDSHQGMVGGRANPKRLEELAWMLAELRDWAWIEAKVETEKSNQEIWLQVRDWANGAAAEKKLNLDSVPVALKQHTANAGMESSNDPSSQIGATK
jgi:hypothetical protein